MNDAQDKLTVAATTAYAALATITVGTATTLLDEAA